MKTDSDFIPITAKSPVVDVQLDGKYYQLQQGDNLAAALLSAGVCIFQNNQNSGKPRAPFCMMGACYDCLVEIDGIRVQACMTTVKQGLKVTRPRLKII